MASEETDYGSQDIDYLKSEREKAFNRLKSTPVRDPSYLQLKRNFDRLDERMSKLKKESFFKDREAARDDPKKAKKEREAAALRSQKIAEEEDEAAKTAVRERKQKEEKEKELRIAQAKKPTEEEEKFMETYGRLHSEGSLNYIDLCRELNMVPNRVDAHLKNLGKKGIRLPPVSLQKAKSLDPRMTDREYLLHKKLEELSKDWPVSRTELAEAMKIHPHAINSRLSRMAQKGVVTEGMIIKDIAEERVGLQVVSDKGKRLPNLEMSQGEAEVYSAVEFLAEKGKLSRESLCEHINRGKEGREVGWTKICTHLSRLEQMKEYGLPLRDIEGIKKNGAKKAGRR